MIDRRGKPTLIKRVINSKTGKITLKKKIRKCTIYVKATFKANKNRKAKTKTVKIVVKKK